MSKNTKIEYVQKPTAVQARFTAYIYLESGLKYEFMATGGQDDDMLDVWGAEEGIDPDDQDWFIWEVVFALHDPDRKYGEFSRNTGRVDIGKKDALELFAALEVVFKEFVGTVNPHKFYYTADDDDPSRVKLYNLLAKRIEKAGYDVYQEYPSIWEFTRDSMWW